MTRTQPLTTFALLLLAPPLAADVTFTDDTFQPLNWSVTMTGNGSVAASQVALGGNPAEYRQVTNLPDIGLTVSGWHFQSQFVYDPAASGAIESVSWSVDFLNVDSGQYAALAILQDGIRYSPGSSAVVTTGQGSSWVNHSFGDLVESDFGTPDFSSSGSPITFGFLSANSYNPSAGNIPNTVGYDNLSITVVSVPASVPAASPCGLALMIGLLVGTAALVLRD